MNQRGAILVALFLAMALMAWRNDRAAMGNKGRLAVEIEGRTAILHWAAPIEAPMARRIAEVYSEVGGDVDEFIVGLDSPGGSVAQGRAVIAILHDIKSTHRLVTYVDDAADCLSMCVPVYLAGTRRIAGPTARFMFHEPTTRDSLTGDRVKRPRFESRWATARFVEKYFQRSEMDPAWRKSLTSTWSGRDVWKSGAELVDERAGVVTDLSGGPL
ncbi:MAG: hypothetical protein GC152_04730 [Alphaproteobacteria bacterium]|nr:hypothetical protein [Alphaproteobacteria bacterium]